MRPYEQYIHTFAVRKYEDLSLLKVNSIFDSQKFTSRKSAIARDKTIVLAIVFFKVFFSIALK